MPKLDSPISHPLPQDVAISPDIDEPPGDSVSSFPMNRRVQALERVEALWSGEVERRVSPQHEGAFIAKRAHVWQLSAELALPPVGSTARTLEELTARVEAVCTEIDELMQNPPPATHRPATPTPMSCPASGVSPPAGPQDQPVCTPQPTKSQPVGVQPPVGTMRFGSIRMKSSALEQNPQASEECAQALELIKDIWNKKPE